MLAPCAQAICARVRGRGGPRRTRRTTPAASTTARVPPDGSACNTHPPLPLPSPEIHPTPISILTISSSPTPGGHPRRQPAPAPACRSRRRTEALGLCGSVGVLHVKAYLSIFHVCLRSRLRFPGSPTPRPARLETPETPHSGLRTRPADGSGATPHTSPTAIPWHPACPIVRCGALGRERAEISPRRAMPSPSKPIAGPG